MSAQAKVALAADNLFPPTIRPGDDQRMNITDIKQLGADVKRFTADARATGPKSEKGKLRSAINAVKHGLAGKSLLLPGEDPVEYEARLDAIFASLGPKNDAEAEIVALVADDIWKLGRLARIEKGISLGRIEELLAQTDSSEKSRSTVEAIHRLGAALTAWSATPLPVEKGPEYARRFRAMSEAVYLTGDTVPEVPAPLLGACNDQLARLQATRGETKVSAEVYAALFAAARVLMTWLLDRGHAVDAAQEELRAAVAGISLPDREELAKLSKYRTMLELSVQRRLAALEQLRKLTAGKADDAAGVDKAKYFRVKLRVVA